MSDRTPREEAASIAQSLRLYAQRQSAAGGELLANATARIAAQRRAEGKRPEPWEPAVGVVEPVAEPEMAMTAAGRVAESVDTDENLFGERVPAARAAAAESQGVATATIDDFTLPPFADDLNPGSWDARAALSELALPVLDEVAALARVCVKCGLCQTRTKAVPGVGSARSGIVFVGEAPGAEEDARGEPFVGRAGELLTRIIQAMDDAKLIPGVPLNRETVFICNVLKCRPPENRNPLPHEIESCSPYLIRQLDALKPRVICCLGKFAAELLLGVKGTIAGMRGKTYRYQGAKLIVTYHPAYCLRNPNAKRPVWEDMQRLAREYLTD